LKDSGLENRQMPSRDGNILRLHGFLPWHAIVCTAGLRREAFTWRLYKLRHLLVFFLQFAKTVQTDEASTNPACTPRPADLLRSQTCRKGSA
jgi:hypothetical protein